MHNVLLHVHFWYGANYVYLFKEVFKFSLFGVVTWLDLHIITPHNIDFSIFKE